ncbi:unnamed protein product [Moneuplotes crassus]|uniref:SprT-like domain-containing protein n=1 Tax=Euplotes crassus TaxID=5936 RepID=A0AAD1UBR4_EUPCR|nr:unnamed protein product [Moneuplotes crassus]
MKDLTIAHHKSLKEELKSKENKAVLEEDIWSLFTIYNEMFFFGTLGTTLVEWSNRMTECAGICYKKQGYCIIRLSKKLLKFRSIQELHETLLHEMIHAYLFTVDPNYSRTDDGHGADFQKLMKEINKATGYNITIYHKFHDEVEATKEHIWLCDGICQKQRPFFGLVKRASNRAPGPNDFWWERHKQTCGGTYHKIHEPDKKEKKPKKPKKQQKTNRKINDYFGKKKVEETKQENPTKKPESKTKAKPTKEETKKDNACNKEIQKRKRTPPKDSFDLSDLFSPLESQMDLINTQDLMSDFSRNCSEKKEERIKVNKFILLNDKQEG